MGREPPLKASDLAAGGGDDLFGVVVSKVRHPSLGLSERAVAEVRPSRLK
jgi:hypothetical protein